MKRALERMFALEQDTFGTHVIVTAARSSRREQQRFLCVPKIRRAVKLVTFEKGKHVDSLNKARSCMTSANQRMRQNGLGSLWATRDARQYRSCQHRDRVHAAWSDTDCSRNEVVYAQVLDLFQEGCILTKNFGIEY